jgi:hypothetical protein
MGIFNLLKRLLRKYKEKDEVVITSFFGEYKSQNIKKNDFKERYVEPKRAENYTKHDLISLQAWVSDVKEDNPDGINRQEILSKCSINDDVTFRLLEYKEGYYMIEVHTVYGCLGLMYISELQKMARYILNGGIIHNAKISTLKYPKTKRGKIECGITFERNKMR